MMNNFQKKLTALLPTFPILVISAIVFFLSACIATAERAPYYTNEPSSRSGDFHGIQGLWFLTAANVTGKLEFHWAEGAWSGRIWLDVYQQWEPLTNIFFDPHTGGLQFTRPNYNIRYIGTLSGNQIVGTCVYQGATYSWEARRP